MEEQAYPAEPGPAPPGQLAPPDWPPPGANGEGARQEPLAFEVFFREAYLPVLRALSVGAENAEDAVQDAFVEAYRRWAGISHYDDPVAWVRLVATRRLLNRHRNALRRLVLRRRALPVVELRAGVDPAVIDLVSAVRRLPPRQRMAVALHYFAGFSLAEVAADMGVREGTIKATLHKARAHLRLELEDLDGPA